MATFGGGERQRDLCSGNGFRVYIFEAKMSGFLKVDLRPIDYTIHIYYI